MQDSKHHLLQPQTICIAHRAAAAHTRSLTTSVLHVGGHSGGWRGNRSCRLDGLGGGLQRAWLGPVDLIRGLVHQLWVRPDVLQHLLHKRQGEAYVLPGPLSSQLNPNPSPVCTPTLPPFPPQPYLALRGTCNANEARAGGTGKGAPGKQPTPCTLGSPTIHGPQPCP
jgi:hypothetical protein